MDDADFELLKAEAFAHTVRHDVALAAAVSRIERDLALMMEKITRIEESIMVPPGGWDDDDVELTDPPF
jgi:hypothetical protein